MQKWCKCTKRVLPLILVFALLLVSPVMAAAPSVQLDGKQLTFEVPPIIENGRTLVPLRAIFEAMGAQVSWDQLTNTATASKGDKTIVLQIGSPTATINGQIKRLDVPAKIVNGRTLAPLRFVGEAFGGTVGWDPSTYMITLISTSDPSLVGLSKFNPVPKGKSYLTKQGIAIMVNQMLQDGAAWAVLEENSSNRPPYVENKYVLITVTVKNVFSPKNPVPIGYGDFNLAGSSNTLFKSYDQSVYLQSVGSLSTLRENLYLGEEEMGSTVYYVGKTEKDMLLVWQANSAAPIYFSLD
ncbi:MAG: copper amine oxidase N-terminal domain-containing protein [Syntrophomonadaceae bacterium]